MLLLSDLLLECLNIMTFAGDVYFKVERNKENEIDVVEGYPKAISTGWDGLEGNIDAAFTNETISASYFFKGDRYWKYDFESQTMFKGFPKQIPPKIPKNLRATISSLSVTYFFTDTGVYKHDGSKDTLEMVNEREPMVEAAFPLFVRGYFATTHGSSYSIYTVKNLEAIKVYKGRPLSWDYGLPMCRGDVLDITVSPKMLVLCEAYAMLAFTDDKITIPRECYSLQPFNVKPLQEISIK